MNTVILGISLSVIIFNIQKAWSQFNLLHTQKKKKVIQWFYLEQVHIRFGMMTPVLFSTHVLTKLGASNEEILVISNSLNYQTIPVAQQPLILSKCQH